MLISMIADRWARRLFAARNGTLGVPPKPVEKIKEVIDELKTGIAETSNSIEMKGRLWALTSFPAGSEASVSELRQSTVFVNEQVLPALEAAHTSNDAAKAAAALKTASENLSKEHEKYHALRDRAKGLSWPGLFQTARLAINSRIAIGLSSAVLSLVVAAFGIYLPKELQRREKEEKLRGGLQQRVSSIKQHVQNYTGKPAFEQRVAYSNVWTLVVGDSRHPVIDPELTIGIVVMIQRLGFDCHLTNGYEQAHASATELTRYVTSTAETNFSVATVSNLVETISAYSRSYPAN